MKMSIKLILVVAVTVCAIQHVIGYPGPLLDKSLLDKIAVLSLDISHMSWNLYNATYNITTTAMNAVSKLWTSGDVIIASDLLNIVNPLSSAAIAVVSFGASTVANTYYSIGPFLPASSQPILRGVVGDLQISIKQLEDLGVEVVLSADALEGRLTENVVPCMNTFVQSVESATFAGVSAIATAGLVVIDAANSILFSERVSSIQISGLIATGNALTTSITDLADVYSAGPESLIKCLDN